MLKFLGILSLVIIVHADFDECSDDLCKGEGNLEALNARYPSIPGARLPSVVFGTHHYFFNRYTTVTWIQAMEFCRRFNMLLVSIETEDEHKFLISHASALVEEDTKGFWTSGNDLSSNGTFVWASTGQKIPPQKWYNNENPFSYESDSGKENCVLLYRFPGPKWKWNDSICMHHQYFICEGEEEKVKIKEPTVQSEKKRSKKTKNNMQGLLMSPQMKGVIVEKYTYVNMKT